MIINTKNFGELVFEEKEKIYFKEGLYGFEDQKEFILLNNYDTEEPVPFMWLQSVVDPELTFVISIPFFLRVDYEFEIPEEVCSDLKVTQPSDVAVYSICKVTDDIEDMTVNLQSPLVINASTRQGRQIVLYESAYKIDQKL